MNNKLKLYLATVYVLFAICAIFLFVNYYKVVSSEEIFFFLLILFITHNMSLLANTLNDSVISINLPILLPAMTVLGPFWTAVIAGIGTIEFRNQKITWYKYLFNSAMFFMAGGSAAIVFQYAKIYFNSSYLLLPLLLGAITYFLVNNMLMFLVLKFAKNEGSSFLIFTSQLIKNLFVSYFMGLIFYYSFLQFGKIVFILGIILIYIIKDFLYSRIQQINSFTQIVEGFLKVIDSKDHYTEGHCQRVARYTYTLCQELGLRRSKLERIVNMAKIHDIGKIYIEDQILKSSDTLTKREYEKMKEHSAYGYEVLKDIDLLERDLDIILHHHERYDGGGYPEGIKGDEIPLGARILSVCDAFDVMTTGRSYKPALNKKEVISELKKCSGGQFDPRIAKTMITLIESNKFDDSFRNEDTGAVDEEGLQYSLNMT